MSVLLPKVRLSVPSKETYFSYLSSCYSLLQTCNYLTDLHLVSQDGVTVPVHRAVLLPVCPLLGGLLHHISMDEAATVLLPASSRSVEDMVSLLYSGHSPPMSYSHQEQLRDLIHHLGLSIQIQIEEREDTVETAEDILEMAEDTVEMAEGNGDMSEDTIDMVEERDKDDMKDTKSQVIEFGKIIKIKKEKPVNKKKHKAKKTHPSNIVMKMDQETSSSIKRSEVSKDEVGGTNYNYCWKCHLKFPNRVHQREHLATVHGEEILSCNLCDYISLDNIMLKAHKYKAHTGKVNGKFVCNICGFRENTKELLSKHKLNRHKASVKTEQSSVIKKEKKISKAKGDKDYLIHIPTFTTCIKKIRKGRAKKQKLDIDTELKEDMFGHQEHVKDDVISNVRKYLDVERNEDNVDVSPIRKVGRRRKQKLSITCEPKKEITGSPDRFKDEV